MQGKVHHCAFCHDQLCIHKVPMFSSLSHSDLLKVSDRIIHKEFQKGEFIFKEGDGLNSIVIINEGSTKAFSYTSGGREQILYIFSEGDFFGEEHLFRDGVATYTVEALEKTKICTLTKNEFREIIIDHPRIAIKIINELGNRMERLETALQSSGIRSVDARVGSLLLDFSKRYGTEESEGIKIKLPLSREGLANYLGIARETASRKLGQLESDGIIRSINNKTILIVDKGALEEYADL
jgi:CRP/FNR family transcriptional regulator, anaerobic regulatory protein